MLPDQDLEATNMKRKHMNHIQDIIRRLQLGESERRIARDMHIRAEDRAQVSRDCERARVSGKARRPSPVTVN